MMWITITTCQPAEIHINPWKVDRRLRQSCAKLYLIYYLSASNMMHREEYVAGNKLFTNNIDHQEKIPLKYIKDHVIQGK